MLISFEDEKSFIEGVCLNDIIKNQPTPFYIYSQETITKKYKTLYDTLKSEIFFSVKANSNQAILTLMCNLGAGADVVSVGELERAICAGFNPNQIIFEGVGKSLDDIKYAINKNIRLINVESIEELETINSIGKSINKIVNIGIRLNPDINSNSLDKISTGKKTDKFGISLDQLKQIIDLVKLSKYIKLQGISCHIGSQINEISIYEKLFLTMKDLAQIIISNGIDIKYLDLGGGFAVNYEKNDDDLDINIISKLINSIFSKVSYKLSFEPGRYLVAKSGIIITKILTSKTNGGINFLITDAGMQTIIRPAMYGAVHRIESLSSFNKENKIYTVAGPICESSDIISKNISLPLQKSQNYLAIHDVGAYGAVMATNYNSRSLPAEILINAKKFYTIRQSENISKVIEKDNVPEWLKSN